MNTTRANGLLRAGNRVLSAAGLLLFAAVLSFCCFYILSDYDKLARWYTGLGGCFYHSGQWAADFFTPRIKSDGNMYSALGAAAALYGALSCAGFLRGKNVSQAPSGIKTAKRDIIPALGFLSLAFALWLWGYGMAKPASDEVFSACNVAGIHPFQAVSYYMLPNNHLFFNALNAVLFHWFPDKVVTGRVISLVAYWAFIFVVYRSFSIAGLRRAPALLAALACAMQFPVWGFSFQARGYELYLLSEAVMAFSLFAYLLTGKAWWLTVNAASIAAGYFCLPSFLYFHAAQLVFMAAYTTGSRRGSMLFWKRQLAAMAVVFLCYLPALCFSGLDAIAHNNYVAPMSKTMQGFCQWMLPLFGDYVDHIFSNVHFGGFSANVVLWALPLLLLLGKRNSLYRMFGLFYLSAWISLLLIVLAMKRLPFERNLVGHSALALFGILLTIWWMVDTIADKMKKEGIKLILYPALPLLWICHFAVTNEKHLIRDLYEYDVNKFYNDVSATLDSIPAGSAVGLSDEAFYASYICRKHGDKTAQCPAGTESYYVKQRWEAVPPVFGAYEHLSTSGDFDIYRKK